MGMSLPRKRGCGNGLGYLGPRPLLDRIPKLCDCRSISSLPSPFRVEMESCCPVLGKSAFLAPPPPAPAGSRSWLTTTEGGRPVGSVPHRDPDRRTSFLVSAKFPSHNTTRPPKPGSIQFVGLAPVGGALRMGRGAGPLIIVRQKPHHPAGTIADG